MDDSLISSAKTIREKFLGMTSIEELAALLNLDHSYLLDFRANFKSHQKYINFSIPKKSGGVRQIYAPIRELKKLQSSINSMLQEVYKPKGAAHGFIRNKNIVSNASPHTGKKYVFNIDLEDFFPSIHFGRVVGLLTKKPYFVSKEVATFIAQVCCYKGKLPQGAPTSPILSNMICARMDSQLQALAKSHRCYYTRYADDITFSTKMSTFPSALVTINIASQPEVGAELDNIIRQNGFVINHKKVRLQGKYNRQEVTGVTVNEDPNVSQKLIRQVRAMLYSWREHGYENAQNHFIKMYDNKKRRISKEFPIFKSVLKGKIDFIGMVKGKEDFTYLNFLQQFSDLEVGITNKRRPPSTVSEEEITSKKELIETYRSNLRFYIQQRAMHGILHTPLPTYNGINDCRNNIKNIKRILRGWGIFVINHPDDEE